MGYIFKDLDSFSVFDIPCRALRRDLYLPKIIENCFKPVPENSEEREFYGWVNIVKMTDTDEIWLSIDDHIFVDDFVLLSLRIDRKIISRERYEKALALRGKEKAKAYVLRSTVPKTRYYRMVWDRVQDKAVLASADKKVIKIFLSLFRKTFDGFDINLEMSFNRKQLKCHPDTEAFKAFYIKEYMDVRLKNRFKKKDMCTCPVCKADRELNISYANRLFQR